MVEEPNISLADAITYEDLCPTSEKYKLYLQGNIQITAIEKVPQQLSKSSLTTTAKSKPESRLIAPIIIEHTDISAVALATVPAFDIAKPKSVLWGWLVADRYQSARTWQVEEISLLQELATQLAIGIKQANLHQRLSELAWLDPLTRIYNRRYFDRQLNLEWRRLSRDSSSLSLLMCDVDYFKLYNDTYGHQQGDKCLQQVAKAISSVLKRPGDTLARYGGEEFVAILANTPKSGAVKVAKAIQTAIAKLNVPHPNSLVGSGAITMSVGIASTIPKTQKDPHLLIEASDLALYQAKEQGRNSIAVYSEPISNSQDRQKFTIGWVKRIRQALKQDSFRLYAQSITPLKSDNRPKYFEILLRLADRDNELISPHTFMTIAEENFLMVEIDTWVINNLFKQLENQSDRNSWHEYRFSINLSGASLNSEPFMEFLVEKLTNCIFPPQLFCFEITETVAILDLSRVVEFINSIKNFGCSFALDDFGKGMSSLTYLQNLPVDYLKIDGSFIKELNNTQKSSKFMVEAINHIAEGIGLKTIAEFVENQSTLDTLRELEVDYAQGFHLGRPELLQEAICI